jgi:hypothetical protein
MRVEDKYILDGQTPVQVFDLMEWANWYQKADRRVAKDFVGRAEISTVFLSMDHNWYGPNHPPVLFETMVFGGGFLNEEMVRYCTWAEAEAGHKDVVETVQAYADRLQRYDALREHDRYLRFPKPKRAPFWCPSTIFKEPRRKWKRTAT